MSVTGDKEVIRALKKLGTRSSKALRHGINATAQQVRNTAIKSIQGQSQGAVVIRYSQGGGAYEHVASSPGDAPNTDTGALVKSIAVEQPNDANAFVGTGLDYGLFLEFGTTNMKPRPWLQPALDGNIKNLNDNISKSVQRLINERK